MSLHYPAIPMCPDPLHLSLSRSPPLSPPPPLAPRSLLTCTGLWWGRCRRTPWWSGSPGCTTWPEGGGLQGCLGKRYRMQGGEGGRYGVYMGRDYIHARGWGHWVMYQVEPNKKSLSSLIVIIRGQGRDRAGRGDTGRPEAQWGLSRHSTRTSHSTRISYGGLAVRGGNGMIKSQS